MFCRQIQSWIVNGNKKVYICDNCRQKLQRDVWKNKKEFDKSAIKIWLNKGISAVYISRGWVHICLGSYYLFLIINLINGAHGSCTVTCKLQ